MSISKEYWVRCDVCGDMNFPSFTSKQARSEAKKIGGWAYVDGKDYCPRHTPNKACSRRVPRRGAKVVKSKSKVVVGRTRG